MTTKEKRIALDALCGRYCLCLDGCPLWKKYGATGGCDFGYSDKNVDAMYDLAFPNTPTDAVNTPTEPTIKDSGERRQFDTGAVRDMATGKGRMDLLPWAAIMEVSKHCENGAKKYGAHNVDKGLPTSSFADSATRHIAKWIDGWTDEPHLLAAAWNLLWAIQMELKHPELCDVPWKGADDERKAD